MFLWPPGYWSLASGVADALISHGSSQEVGQLGNGKEGSLRSG